MSFVPVISGLGLITPIGRGVQNTWSALLRGQHITTHARVESQVLNVPRVTGLAIEAAREAIATVNSRDDEVALIVGTSKGPIESWMQDGKKPTSSPYLPKSDKPMAGRVNFGLAEMTDGLAEAIGLQTSRKLTLSAACASGLHALIRAAMMIRSGEVRRALVVSAEASVHPLFIGSFERLGVIPPNGELCRPFDVNRKGFLMSEAAAAVWLQAWDGFSPGIAVDRFALAGEAASLTAGDSDGRVLRHVLKTVGGDHQPFDLIHAHGTGTLLNDEHELRTIEAANVAKPETTIYSHKGSLGHSLGASGLVGVVLNCLIHRTGQVPAMATTTQPIQTSPRLANQPQNQSINRSVVIASGFGGPTAAVGLRTIR